jgi:hypothetical protein
VSESPPIPLLILDLVLFREVEQLLFDSILDDAREDAAFRDIFEDASNSW